VSLIDWLICRDVISVFSRGGKKLIDYLRGGGQNMKKILCAKHKSLYFSNLGWDANAPLPPPQMTSLLIQLQNSAILKKGLKII